MKEFILLICVCWIISYKEVLSSAIRAPLDIISLDDITPEERKELDYLHSKQERPKRSGDILEALKTAIGHGIKKKIGEIAHGSASASARLSSSNSDYGYYPSYHHIPETYDHKSFDFWSLKKSILNTLLQAVKAIKGGLIAVKGQLIKGGGKLVSAKGKLISAKGDAITKLGKEIAASALLVPYHGHGHEGYSPTETHYSAPSAPEDIYHTPHSAPAPVYHEPDHFPPQHDDETSHGGHSGILILKKIPRGKHTHHHHVEDDSKLSNLKAIEHGDPGLGAIIGKFLSASSSLNPHYPEPFGHTAPSDIHPYHSESHLVEEESAPVGYHKKHKVEPSASGYVIDDDPLNNKPSSYDSTFEKEPSYLSQSFNEHQTSESKKNTHAIKLNSISSQIAEKPNKNTTIVKESSKPSSSGSSQIFLQNNFDIPTISSQSLSSSGSSSISTDNLLDNYNKYKNSLYDLPNISDYPNGFPGLVQLPQSTGEIAASFLDQPSNGANLFGQPPTGANLFDETTGIDLSASSKQPSFSDISSIDYVGPQSFARPEFNAEKHNLVPTPYLQSPKQTYIMPTPFIAPPKGFTTHDSPTTPKRHKTSSSKHPTFSKRPNNNRPTKHRPKQTYDVVRSVSYELGPNGPTRLT